MGTRFSCVFIIPYQKSKGNQNSKSNISNWRKGDNVPSVEVLTKVCKYLDVSADYLLGLSDY